MQFSFTQVLLLWMLFIMAFGTTFLMLMDEVTACSNGEKKNYNQKRNNGPNTFKRSFKHTHIALFEKSVKSL